MSQGPVLAQGVLRASGLTEGRESKPWPLDRLAEALLDAPGVVKVASNEPLARHTALRVGGPAELTAVVGTSAGLCNAVLLAWSASVPCRTLGGGSNVLVDDKGLPGLVVLNRARGITFSEDGLLAESGATLPTLARKSVDRGLAGLEWSVGIPGTVGGAVVGNAGAWGGDMASVVAAARVLEPGGDVSRWPAERFQFGYRYSVLKYRTADAELRPVVLEVEFALKPHHRRSLEARVSEIVAQRRSSQPTGATCGSVFKNPPGDSAGRLIEAAGLKGTRCGPAEISPRHANFVINHGGATAADVWTLVNLAQREVAEQFGILLHLEIELLGLWPSRVRNGSDGCHHDT